MLQKWKQVQHSQYHIWPCGKSLWRNSRVEEELSTNTKEIKSSHLKIEEIAKFGCREEKMAVVNNGNHSYF